MHSCEGDFVKEKILKIQHLVFLLDHLPTISVIKNVLFILLREKIDYDILDEKRNTHLHNRVIEVFVNGIFILLKETYSD